ncbi:hypothetical protein [Lactococcus petauri]|uniref:hypothetical protein n=1 Tax=Lactococcus petauri TaxID=1940789 RepID=UPI0022DF3251|nr:hypothetical protein [Lactococcus petauri]
MKVLINQKKPLYWSKVKKASVVGLTTLLVVVKGTAPAVANTVRTRFCGTDFTIGQIHEVPDQGVLMDHFVGQEDGTQTPMTSEDKQNKIVTEAGYVPIMPLAETQEEAPARLKGPRQNPAYYMKETVEHLTERPWNIVTKTTLATGVLLAVTSGIVLKNILKK